MTGDQHRRRFLTTLGAVTVTSLAGCSSGSSTDDQPATTDATGTATPDDTTGQSGTDTPGTGERQKDGGETTTEPHTVEFESPAGTTVTGTLAGRGDCGVVFVPQVNLDRESWRPQRERFAAAGHRVLTIDEGERKTAAVRGAVQYLQSAHGIQQLVLVGASSGGEAVVEAAAAELAVDAVAALSPAGGSDAAGSLDARLLVVVSDGDEDRFVRTARDIHEGAAEPKELVTYDGAAHGQGLFESEHGDRLRQTLDEFVTTACGDA
ncbi:dienelactone hydrolase family protein [Haloarchaeobius sp. TZWSO28]|uniref:dienelactone hydrolase family protein n=1 Tax=Haloarchaeobius sp. TZWSO28 TaxID=3446119 RepID=UPI003EB86AF1